MSNNNNTIKGLAGAALEGLKGQPFLLALVLLNAMGIGAALYYLRSVDLEQQQNVALLLKACLHQ